MAGDYDDHTTRVPPHPAVAEDPPAVDRDSQQHKIPISELHRLDRQGFIEREHERDAGKAERANRLSLAPEFETRSGSGFNQGGGYGPGVGLSTRGNPGTVAPPDRLSVQTLFDELGGAMKALEMTVDQLDTVLNPILVPAAPRNETEAKAPEHAVPILRGLTTFLRDVNRVRRRVEDLGQRVAL